MQQFHSPGNPAAPNPYQSPSATESAATDGAPPNSESGGNVLLHSAAGATVAAFFGSFLAGAVILAINFWRVGRRSVAIAAVVLGVLATAMLGAIDLMVRPKNVNSPNLLLFGAQLVAMAWAATVVNANIQRGLSPNAWRYSSVWWAAAIGLLVGILAFAIVMCVVGGLAILSDQ